jgi:hypothetical protein
MGRRSNPVWSGSLIFAMTTSSGYLKRIRIKEPLVPGISKPSKTARFHERTSKYLAFF